METIILMIYLSLFQTNGFDVDAIMESSKSKKENNTIEIKKFTKDSQKTFSNIKSEYYNKHEYIPPSAVQNNYSYDSHQSTSNNTTSSNNRSSQTASRQSKRGIKRIASNGKVSGVSSQRIECSGGSDYIVYYKNGKWYKNASHMGNKFNSWTVNQVGDYLCR